MTSQPSGETAASTPQRIGWAILIVVTLYICYFSHLGVIGFVGPDEPRYAWIARDMAETGDWVTPRLYGKPWFEKPPLLYWGGAIFFKLFASSAPEAAARLPSAISALLATLALAWLAWRSYGEECARWLLLLLPTSVGMIGFSHAAATDMPFAGMLTMAMVCAAVALGLTKSENTPILPHTPLVALLLFGFFLGLAVLAKGPAAIILSGGAVFFWALFTKRWRDAFRLLHPATIASFCLTALPWYILCARRNPDFFRIFIIEHNFKRYFTPEFQHIQPFWFYGPVLLVAFLPWAVIFLWSSVQGAILLWRTRRMKERVWFLVCWAGFCVVFFSISRSKLPGYVVPAIPAICLLMAHDVTRRLQRRLGDVRWLSVGVGLTLIVLGVVAERLNSGIPLVTDIRPAPTVMQFAALMVFVGIAVGVLGLLRRGAASVGLAAIALPVFLIVGTGDLWELDEGVSARPAAIGAIEHLPPSELGTAATYKLRRGLKYGLDFYFHRELKEWSPPPGRSSIILTTHKGAQELEHIGIRCFYYIAYPAVETCVDSSKIASLVPGLGDGGGKTQ